MDLFEVQMDPRFPLLFGIHLARARLLQHFIYPLKIYYFMGTHIGFIILQTSIEYECS